MNQYSKYKQSAMIGLERIPSHWKELRFKNICSLVRDSAHPGDRKIALENIESSTGRFISTNSDFGGEGVHFEKEDVLFGKLRPYLAKVYLAQDTGQAIGDFYVFRAKDNVLPDYLQKLAISVPFIGLVNSGTYGAKMPRASWNDISQLVVPLPPVYEQKAIISFLSLSSERIERAIKSKQRQIELLEEYKQAIIAQVVTRGLNPDVKMKPTGYFWLPEIPENWKIKRMKYLFTERSEKNHPDEQMLSATQTYGVIPQSQYGNRVVVVNTGFEGLKLVKVGDFVIHLRSFQGGIEISHAQGIISSAYTILRPIISDDGDYSPYFRFLFKSQNFIDLLKICVTGIREGQNINYAKLKQYFLPIPPIEEQKRIVKYIDTKTSEIDTLLSSIAKEISLLQEYKQRLISDVVTGQINVQNEIV